MVEDKSKRGQSAVLPSPFQRDYLGVESPFYRLQCCRPQGVKRGLLNPLEVTLSAVNSI